MKKGEKKYKEYIVDYIPANPIHSIRIFAPSKKAAEKYVSRNLTGVEVVKVTQRREIPQKKRKK